MVSRQVKPCNLQSLQSELMALDTRIADVTRQFACISHDVEACQRLQESEGIGPLSATTLVAALGHGHDVEYGRQVAARLGLVPRQQSSGGTTRLGEITKGGNGYVRRLLMHGARSAIGHVRDKTDAKSTWIRQLVAWVAWALLHTGERYRKPEAIPAWSVQGCREDDEEHLNRMSQKIEIDSKRFSWKRTQSTRGRLRHMYQA
jgi:hypothetical protein